jgi:glycogen debranching enzyme
VIDFSITPRTLPPFWTERALETIERNVRIHRSHTIVQPSPTYEGLWARDTMIIVQGLLAASRVELAGSLLRAWSAYSIRPSDDPSSYLLLNKHRAPWTEAEISRPEPSWLEENRGGLPTCIYVGRDDYPDDTREIYSCHPDPDSTAWWLVGCAAYVRAGGRENFAGELHDELQAALDYLVRRDSDGDLLVEQCPNEDWADHMRRHGKVTYTEAVWYGAVRAAETLGLRGPNPAGVRAAIRHTLFTRHGVLDWQCPESRSTRVAQDSALLVLFDLVDPGESAWLLRRLERLAAPYGHRVVAPTFRSTRMGPYHFKRGEYQNGGIWTWLTGWEAQARARLGDVGGAIHLVDTCFCPGCHKIYEWIDPQRGHRYNPDFATGAGSILSAIAAIQNAVQ